MTWAHRSNPAIDRGQIEGGYMQGVGWLCTREELVWDEAGRLRRTAPPRTNSLGCSDRPDVFNVTLYRANREPTMLSIQGGGRAAVHVGHLGLSGAQRCGRQLWRQLSGAGCPGDRRTGLDRDPEGPSWGLIWQSCVPRSPIKPHDRPSRVQTCSAVAEIRRCVSGWRPLSISVRGRGGSPAAFGPGFAIVAVTTSR